MNRNLALLRSLVAQDADAVARALFDPGADLPQFFGFLRRHNLGSFSYWMLNRLELASRLPRPLAIAAKATALLERSVSEQLLEQMHELGRIFDGGSTPVMFIKGPLLAQRYYGRVEARNIGDLDILIRTPADLADVEARLIEAGFEPAFRILLSRRISRYFSHHFEYRRGGLPLDVHWALQRHFTFAIDYDRIWSTAAQVESGGRTFLATSDEYEIVLQVLGVLTDMQVGKLTLRPLVDLIQILRATGPTTDWQTFLEARRRERILHPTAFVLALAIEVLDCRSEFANLHAAIAPILETLPATSMAEGALLASRPLDLRQKILALRIYEAPLVASLAWWLVSLPVRLAVYGIVNRPLRG